MVTLEKIIEEIEVLKGSTVKVFGQPTKLEEDFDDIYIDVIDVLYNLKSHEIDLRDYFEEDYNLGLINDDNADDIIDLFCEYGYINSNIYDSVDNTYNWNSPITHDIAYHIYKGEFFTFVTLMVHKYGDVRGNYTDEVVLKFDSVEEFYECLGENNTYKYFIVNDKEYSAYINIFADTYEIYDEDGDYVCAVGACDMEDLKKEVEMHL